MNQNIIDIFKKDFWNPSNERDVYAFSCYPWIPDDKKAKVRSVFGIDRSEVILIIRNHAPFWRSLSSGFILTDVGFYYISEDQETQFKVEWAEVKEVQYQEQVLYFYGYEGGTAEMPVGFIVNIFDCSDSVFNKSGINLANMFTKMAQCIAPPVNPAEEADENLFELINAGKTDEAIVFAKKCITDFPDEAGYFSLQLSKLYYGNGDYHQTIDAANRGIQNVEYGSELFAELELRRYLACAQLGDIVEARKSSLMVARFANEDWKYDNGVSVQEDSKNDFYGFDEEYVSSFMTLPYKERKVLLIVEKYDDLSQKRVAVLSDKCDFSQFSFPIGHPIANQVYIGHPLIPNKYIPFEDYQLEFVEDKVREFCEFVQDLGATEITIECLNSSSNEKNTSGGRTISGEVSGMVRSVAGNVETNYSHHLIDELSKSISLHQTFQPYKKPVLHPNMIWYQNEPSWQRLYNQRMNGGLSTHEERIETKKSQVIDGKELIDVMAEIKGIFANLNVKFDKNEESKFEQQENAILSINVKFAPLNQLSEQQHSNVGNTDSNSLLSQPFHGDVTATHTHNNNENEYLEEVKQCITNGSISQSERRLLDKLRDKLGITSTKAKELEDSLIQRQLTPEEREYVEEYRAVSVNGEVNEKERRLLDKLRRVLGLSEERAKALESELIIPRDSIKSANPEKNEVEDWIPTNNGSGSVITIEDSGMTTGDAPGEEIKDIAIEGGNRYVGTLDEYGSFSGRGTYYFSDGSRYEGFFSKGMREGSGKYYTPDGDCYEGEWKNDELIGTITINYANGDKYEGETKDGLMSGKGIYYCTDGRKYEGDWVDNCPKGKGKIFFPDGERYEGDWNTIRQGDETTVVRCGHGIAYYPEGQKYEGEWDNDARSGKGKLYFPEGWCFEVTFENDEVQEGRITGINQEGDRIEADLRNGEIGGVCTIEYANGDIYEGEAIIGKRHGKGCLCCADGSMYEGVFVNDMKNGEFIFTQPDGMVKKGVWNNDQFVKWIN